MACATHDRHGETLAALVPDLLRTARAVSRGRDAEDIVQDALLRTWSRLAAGAEIADLAPYLKAAIRNAAKRPARLTETLTEATEPRTPPEAPGRLATIDVLEAIERLPAAHAQLLRYVAEDEASYAEIARRTGLPLGTVMSRLSRARARLRVEMGLEATGSVRSLLSEEV